MTNQEANKLIDNALAVLTDQFDVVSISVTWMEGGRTHSIHGGTGNHLARAGLAMEFLDRFSEHGAKPDEEDDDE